MISRNSPADAEFPGSSGNACRRRMKRGIIEFFEGRLHFVKAVNGPILLSSIVFELKAAIAL
jgi:hypothetical protein